MKRICAVLAAMVLASCSPQGGNTRVPISTTFSIAQAGAQLSLLRAGSGIGEPIVQDPALQAAAQFHADDLAQTGRFDHTGSDGSTVSGRVASAGYRACRVAENIARGPESAGEAVALWRGSQEHLRNMLDAGVTEFGLARSGDTWVLVLARPC